MLLLLPSKTNPCSINFKSPSQPSHANNFSQPHTQQTQAQQHRLQIAKKFGNVFPTIYLQHPHLQDPVHHDKDKSGDTNSLKDTICAESLVDVAVGDVAIGDD